MNSDRLQAIDIDPVSAICWARILTDDEISELVREVDTTATVDAHTLARILATKDHGKHSNGGFDYSEKGLSAFIKRQLLCGGLGVPGDQASTFVDEETTRLPVECLKHVLRMLPVLGMDYRMHMIDQFKAAITGV